MNDSSTSQASQASQASQTQHTRTLAVLGAGAMGSAVLESVLRDGQPAERTRVTTLDPAAQQRWRDAGVAVTDNAEAVRGADLVLVAVKPADVPALLEEVAGELGPDTLVASLAAGVSTATLEAHLPEGTPTVRVMPNTPALLGEGMAALSGGRHAREEHLDAVRELFEAAGKVVVVPEKQQDAVTAISGSGPAYVFTVAEALIDAGVLLGLPRPVATELAIQTLYGSATMLRDSGTHPTLLREQVTSPGGTTAAALRELDRHGLRSALIAGAQAARDRSAELGA